jgi:hypothetical protein
MTACNTNNTAKQDSPETTVRGIFSAIQSENFELALQFCTPSTKESLQDFATNLKMIPLDEKESLLAPFSMQISTVACQDNQGITRCDLCCSDLGEISIEMVQKDDKWYVQMEFLY